MSSWGDEWNESEKPENIDTSATYPASADKLPAAAPLSIVIPPLDLSILHHRDTSEYDVSTFFLLLLL